MSNKDNSNASLFLLFQYFQYLFACLAVKVSCRFVIDVQLAGEVGRAILKQDLPEIKDGIGDMVVVLTNLAELCVNNLGLVES